MPTVTLGIVSDELDDIVGKGIGRVDVRLLVQCAKAAGRRVELRGDVGIAEEGGGGRRSATLVAGEGRDDGIDCEPSYRVSLIRPHALKWLDGSR